MSCSWHGHESSLASPNQSDLTFPKPEVGMSNRKWVWLVWLHPPFLHRGHLQDWQSVPNLQGDNYHKQSYFWPVHVRDLHVVMIDHVTRRAYIQDLGSEV